MSRGEWVVLAVMLVLIVALWTAVFLSDAWVWL